MLRRKIFIGFLVLGAAVSVLMARPGTVKTNDGKTWEGEVAEEKDKVIIKTRGIEVTIPRAEVASIDYQVTNVEEEYKARLAKLPADAGAREHLDLARWLFDNRKYDMARVEAEKAIQLDPGNREATGLLDTIRWQAVLDRSKGTSTPRNPPATTPTETGVPDRLNRALLDADQIQAIKREELRTDDVGTRFRFEKDVLRRYAERQNMQVAQVLAMPDLFKARSIFTRGDAEMRNDVKILNDPSALAEWRRIQPFVLSSCGSANCHGTNASRTFILYGPADSEAVTYTNFYTLSQLGHKVDTVQRRVIDRTRPFDSLLLQYGLPREQADLRHPEVLNFRATFPTGRRDPNFLRTQDWVRNRLLPVEPTYGFAFEIPRAATTQPSE